jgi:hypothetical protein
MPLLLAASASTARRFLLRHWPTWVVLAIGVAVIWPAPIGTMPMSQDHTVHLARAWMYGETLASGHVSQWSSYWYFGFPLGELYPMLGDLACAIVRALSFGKLSWPACYAFVFSAGYLVQGIALLRVAKAIGLGPVPAIVAATLTFLDPGVLREGGWSYTVHYGVWLQPVCCSFLWWAFAEIAPQCDPSAPLQPRKLVLPSVLLGLAMLAHPVALPVLALGAVLFVLHMGVRRGLGRVLVVTGIPVVFGLCVAAWWVLPLIANSAWMANFGTLYNDLVTMLKRMVSGAWSRHMAPAIGYTILAGVLFAWIRGQRFTKFVATFAVVLWLMSTSDFFFRFRLDWLSENFRYLQYQRFIIVAKPGLFLCAGALIAAIFRWGVTAWRSDAPKRTRIVKASLRLALGTGIMLGVGVGAVTAAKEKKVGSIRLNRLASGKATDTKFDKEWQAFGEWAQTQWESREEFWRFAYKSKRHSHALADAPLLTHAPAYKIGFTPGEVFLHKLESEQAAVLDRLRVRYLVGTTIGKGNKIIKRFGRIKVAERKLDEQVARMVNGGEVEVIQDDPDDKGVIVQVSGADEDSRLEFNIAGFPRWELLHDGVPVDWYEVAPLGGNKIATQADRQAGKLRAGQGAMPSPRDPMLIAIDAQDGTYELRYRHWMRADIIGVAAFALGLLGCAVFLARPLVVGRLLERIVGWLRPWVTGTLLALVATAVLARYAAGFLSEWSLASGWLRVGRADDVVGMANGPLKVDRLIGPAILVTAEPETPAHMLLENIEVDEDAEAIEGWIAVDDNAKGGKGIYSFVISGRAAGTDDEYVELLKVPIRVRTGKQTITIPLADLGGATHVDLDVTVSGKGGTTPRMGFDLQL